jgi:hypothetical protein
VREAHRRVRRPLVQRQPIPLPVDERRAREHDVGDVAHPLVLRGGREQVPAPARDTARTFADHVDVVAGRLGDRVEDWITICEPRVISWVGYGSGDHAPGRRSTGDALAAAHHVLLVHGLAVERLRALGEAMDAGVPVRGSFVWSLLDNFEWAFGYSRLRARLRRLRDARAHPEGELHLVPGGRGLLAPRQPAVTLSVRAA